MIQIPRQIILPLTLLISTATATTNTLNRTQFTDMVLHALRTEWSFETSRIDVEIRQLELDSSRQNYANWKLNLDAEYTFEDTDRYRHSINQNNKLTFSSFERTAHDRSVGLEATKRFLWNPASLSLAVDRALPHDQYSDYNTHENSTRYQANLKYPLLKKDGNAENLKTYQRNIWDLRDKQLSFAEAQEDFLDDRLNDFFDAIRFQQQCQLSRAHLHQLNQLQPRSADTNRLTLAQLQLEQQLTEQQTRLDRTRQELATLLQQPELIQTTFHANLHHHRPLIQALMPHLKKYNRDLLRLETDRQLKQIDLAYYANRTLPKLDLQFAIEHLDKASQTKTANTLEDRTDYGAGLTFSMALFEPITDRTELRKSRLQLRKIQINYHDRLRTLLAELTALNQSLPRTEKSLADYQDLIQKAIDSHREIDQQYQDQSQSIEELLRAIEREYTIRHDHLDAAIDYQRDLLDYDNLLDRLLPKQKEPR